MFNTSILEAGLIFKKRTDAGIASEGWSDGLTCDEICGIPWNPLKRLCFSQNWVPQSLMVHTKKGQ